MQATPARSLLYFLSREQRAEAEVISRERERCTYLPREVHTGTESWEVRSGFFFRLFSKLSPHPAVTLLLLGIGGLEVALRWVSQRRLTNTYLHRISQKKNEGNK